MPIFPLVCGSLCSEPGRTKACTRYPLSSSAAMTGRPMVAGPAGQENGITEPLTRARCSPASAPTSTPGHAEHVVVTPNHQCLPIEPGTQILRVALDEEDIVPEADQQIVEAFTLREA